MKKSPHLLSALILVLVCLLSPRAQAQLVADGATQVQNVPVNLLPGNLTVGTNGGNTTLTIFNVGVTNALGRIGPNASSRTNTVNVVNPGARWINTGDLQVGVDGSTSTLRIVSGGVVRMSSPDSATMSPAATTC